MYRHQYDRKVYNDPAKNTCTSLAPFPCIKALKLKTIFETTCIIFSSSLTTIYCITLKGHTTSASYLYLICFPHAGKEKFSNNCNFLWHFLCV